jgi:hypothetical protein
VSAEYEQVPSAVWDALAWFLGHSDEPPDYSWVRAAVSRGFLHRGAGPWLLARQADKFDDGRPRWPRVSLAGRRAWLTDRGADAWLWCCDRLMKRRRKRWRPSGDSVSLDARAVGVFVAHRDWTKKQIAAHLGCAEKSLCPKRCPHLAAAIRAQKSHVDPDRRQVRGSKDAGGRLEAWEKEEE